MKSKKTKIIMLVAISCLLLISTIFAVIHVLTRDNVEEGSILLEVNGESKVILLQELSTDLVEGTVVNGKGEQKQLSSQGLSLKDVLDDAGVIADRVTVTADDEYSAVVEGTEIYDEAKVYLLIENNTADLVVFGDTNSKRNVRNVVNIKVE